MTTRSVCVSVLLALGSIGAHAVHAQPSNARFSYQGQLSDNDAPADGVYDMRFRILSTDGEQYGPTVIVQDVQVIDGLFQIELDFEDAIVSDPGSELQIEVRRDGDADFTALSPNTPIATLPRAGVSELAFQAETLTNPIWSRDTGAKIVGGNGAQRLLFNRSGTITGADFFTLGIPDHGGAYGGMYIDAFDTNQIPFYGFSIGGTSTAWMQYRAAVDRIEARFQGSSSTPIAIGSDGVETEGTLVIKGDAKQRYANGEDWSIGPIARGGVYTAGGMFGCTPNVVSAEWKGSGGGTDYCEIVFDQPLSTDSIVMITPRGDNNYYASYDFDRGNLHVYIYQGSRSTAHSIENTFSFLIFGN